MARQIDDIRRMLLIINKIYATNGQYGDSCVSRINCKLYVPKGCANKYRDAEVWRDFDIEEMEVTGIGSANHDITDRKRDSIVTMSEIWHERMHTVSREDHAE